MNRETIKRTITIGSIILVVLIIVAYAYIASRNLLNGPSIVVTTINDAPATAPVNGVIYGSFATSTVTVNGVAERIQSISLNGSPMVIDQAGNFSQTIALFPGFNAETFTGKDAFGHTTTIELDLNRE